MKATEARQIARNANPAGNQLMKILATISKFAKLGKFECWIYEPVTPDNKKALEEMGYQVGETQFDRHETLTKVSWASHE